jgi:hypothetical protein
VTLAENEVVAIWVQADSLVWKYFIVRVAPSVKLIRLDWAVHASKGYLLAFNDVGQSVLLPLYLIIFARFVVAHLYFVLYIIYVDFIIMTFLKDNHQDMRVDAHLQVMDHCLMLNVLHDPKREQTETLLVVDSFDKYLMAVVLKDKLISE